MTEEDAGAGNCCIEVSAAIDASSVTEPEHQDNVVESSQMGFRRRGDGVATLPEGVEWSEEDMRYRIKISRRSQNCRNQPRQKLKR